LADNRHHPRYPIRLAVRYPSTRSLLGDYTRSVSKGGVAIESDRDLAEGTEFVFEMSSPELPDPVEVRGKVIWTRPAAQVGRFTLGIQYQFDDDERRQRLERVIESILSEHEFERQRKHPRVPVSIEVHGPGQIWQMRDLSVGGAMLQAVSTNPIEVQVGQKLVLEIRVSDLDTALSAEVVWVAQPYALHTELVPGRFGMRFTQLGAEFSPLVEQLMRMQVRPERVGLILRPMPKRGLD
jgi:type IV pilus assembly protein PilZ